MIDNLDQYIKSISVSRTEVQEQEETNRRNRTILKYRETEKRLQEIEEKISRLQKEKDNLLRKQKSRRSFLEQLNGK
jgi:septal ring factor EnvC (AmiA/AmiB activator)